MRYRDNDEYMSEEFRLRLCVAHPEVSGGDRAPLSADKSSLLPTERFKCHHGRVKSLDQEFSATCAPFAGHLDRKLGNHYPLRVSLDLLRSTGIYHFPVPSVLGGESVCSLHMPWTYREDIIRSRALQQYNILSERSSTQR